MSHDRERFLVTGANGHLGRRLLARLASQQREARALVRSDRAASTLRALPFADSLEIRIADYADRDALSRARLEAWKKAHPDEAVAPPPATLTQAAFHGE